MRDGQEELGDDEVWGALDALDRSRRRFYSESGKYASMRVMEIFERARRCLAKVPPAVAGQAGRSRFWNGVCLVVMGFNVHPGEAVGIVRSWNASNDPPFSEAELLATCWRAWRFIDNPRYNPRGRGYMINA